MKNKAFYVNRQDNNTKTATLIKDGTLIVCDVRKALNVNQEERISD